ncbi:MAG: hypothetical protein KC766_14785 [Myxococcales bacterium]|nr:hypothetical protein [Myxococcales bacterium]
MASKLNPSLLLAHALSTLGVIVTALPLSVGVIAEQSAGVGAFDPARGGDPTLLVPGSFTISVLILSAILGLLQLAQLLRDPSRKPLHVYHAMIALGLCAAAASLWRSPTLWSALPAMLLSLLYLGFWSRRLMDPDSR